jgi:hypothetical protein
LARALDRDSTEGDGAAAVPYLEQALAQVADLKETSFQMLLLIDHLRALPDAGRDRSCARRIAASHRSSMARVRVRSIGAGLSPAHVWWWHHQALVRERRAAASDQALENAYELLLEGIGTLSDEGCAAATLNKIETHRGIVEAWIATQRRRRLSAKRRAAHLAGDADVRAPLERLVDTGMRLNELRSAEELHEFLVDEVTELSGAERVLLVLESHAGSRGCLLPVPPGEDARAHCETVGPWLDDARRPAPRACAYCPTTLTSSISVLASSHR